MKMYGLLCTISGKRRALLDEDPEILEDIVHAEEPIPGVLELGKAWDALDVLINDGRDGTGPLGDAILARSGQAFGPKFAYGRGKLLEAARVAEVSRALDALPADLVRARRAVLGRIEVHGGFGRPRTEGAPDAKVERMLAEENFIGPDVAGEVEEDIVGLQLLYDRVRALYREAAKAKAGMFAIVT